MRPTLRSTSTRILVALPVLVLAEQAISRRRLHPRWLPFMAWGSAQLALVTRSPIAAAAAAALPPWFQRRVKGDERRLAERFGEQYVAYTRRVPRWVPGTRPVPAEPCPPARDGGLAGA
jgi:hypothetical protein